MLFYDLRNFEGALQLCERVLLIGKVHYFLVEKINGLLRWDLSNSDIIRAYAYTGVYTPALLQKMKHHIERETDSAHRKKIEEFYSYAERKLDHCDAFVASSAAYNFFELKTWPLQYNPKATEVFQKGVGVGLAVDLISHAYKDAYDIAVVCSGDLGLKSSMDQVKGLGKRVILVSHPRCMSAELRKGADYFIYVSKFSPQELDKISRTFR